MRIIFMGTPDFAVPSLKALIDNNYEVVAVYSQPDKPKGRGHKMQFSPVKELAIENNLKVLQPLSLRNNEAIEELKALVPDMIVVAAYGKMLPKEVLDIPKYGCINVHGSLLPKYRGAAPIQWSVINGDKTTGVTIMYMAEGMDTGDMLLKSETQIGDDETAGELFDRLMYIGADALINAIPQIVGGELMPQKQDDNEATHASMLKKEMAIIDWTWSNEQIKNLVRGLNPWPTAQTTINGKRLKIHSVSLMDKNGEAGKVFTEKGKFCVYCGEGSLMLTEIQAENSKRMAGESYLLGHPLDGTEILGN